ncbi:MAG: amino acid adenylation domain-containing protein, partial [bacterium]|nr:amino acid adenylation domain-containing protein [bacterium]
HFRNLITAAIQNPSQQLGNIRIISEEEKHRLLVEFNDTHRDYPKDKTIHRLFEEQVERFPDHLAVVGPTARQPGEAGKTALTDSLLNEKSNQLEQVLRSKRFESGSIARFEPGNQASFEELNARAEELAASELNFQNKLIGIMMTESIDLLIVILSILKSRNTFVPISVKFPDQRIRFILQDCNIGLLFTDSSNLDRANHVSEGTPCLETVYCVGPRKDNTGRKAVLFNPPTTPIAFDQACYVIYTSGSTGLPKGVPITHRNLSPLMSWSRDYFKLGPQIRVLQNLSYIFDFGVFEQMSTIIFGGRLYFPDPELMSTPLRYVRFIDTHQINTFHTTPSFFRHILHSSPGRQMPSIRNLHFGGEPLTPGLVAKSSERLSEPCTIYNGYGPTENTITSSIYSIKIQKEIAKETSIEISSHAIGESVPVGKPSANNIIYILDRRGHLLPPGAAGELYIGGSGVASGYINRPELSAEKFMTNPFRQGEQFYRTGDRGLWLRDGNIQFLGRIDFQVKIRGFRIEPGEIEKRLEEYNNIKEAIVATREDQNSDKYLCAYVVPAAGEVLIDSLREYLSTVLPAYMVPAYFVPLQRVPLTPTGKVDRKALPDPDPIVGTGEYVAPRNPVEHTLADIWSEILAIDKKEIGIRDNFFHLGGHSLIMLSLISKINYALDVKLRINDVFNSPTIEGLANLVTASDKSIFAAIEPTEEKEYYPVSPDQKRMFILNRFEGIGTTYNLSIVIGIEGNLNPDHVGNACEQLIQRHEALRTSFRLEEGELVQVIHKTVDLNLRFIEAEFSDPETIKQTTADFIQPFDLSAAPLLRVGIVRISENEHLLLVDVHHIISDGVSQNILAREFNRLYSGEILPPLQLNHKDYLEWQHWLIRSGKLQDWEAYWLDVFKGDLPVLNLPISFSRPEVQSFDGDTISFHLPAATSERMNQLAKETGTTLYMLLMAMYAILLHKYSGQEDIVTGTILAGRNHLDLEELVGYLAKTLALRHYPTAEKTFPDFLQEVKSSVLNAFENQLYPFNRLVEKLDMVKDPSRNPLYDAAFVFQNTNMTLSGGTAEQKETDIQFKAPPFGAGDKSAMFDLYFQAAETANGINCMFQYNTMLFEKQSIQLMIERFVTLVDSILDNSSAEIRELDASVAVEKEMSNTPDISFDL